MSEGRVVDVHEHVPRGQLLRPDRSSIAATGPNGMPAPSSARSMSATVRSAVHAATASSISAAFARRPRTSANRGSAARSGRPIAAHSRGNSGFRSRVDVDMAIRGAEPCRRRRVDRARPVARRGCPASPRSRPGSARHENSASRDATSTTSTPVDRGPDRRQGPDRSVQRRDVIRDVRPDEGRRPVGVAGQAHQPGHRLGRWNRTVHVPRAGRSARTPTVTSRSGADLARCVPRHRGPSSRACPGGSSRRARR